MRVTVFGSGYVGLVSGNCLAAIGHEVTFVDVDDGKVAKINNCECPIHETDLPAMLKENLQKGAIHATKDYLKAVSTAEVVFICVGTPSRDDGTIDLDYVEAAARNIGESLKGAGRHVVVVVKSTVVPGTTERVGAIIQEVSGLAPGVDFGLCMNPEFLREGCAVQDFMRPDTIVLGCIDDKTYEVMARLYAGFEEYLYKTSPRTAEMIKYTKNAFLATKISFINEIANICQATGVNVHEVASIVGRDPRISPQFLVAGAGFGGSCFPKDVKALIGLARRSGCEPKVLPAAIEVNESQPLRIIDLAKDYKYERAGVLGIAFKPDTDDIREAPAIKLITELLQMGKTVVAHDPVAMENAKHVFGERVFFAGTMEEVINSSDIIFLVTEWEEYKKLEKMEIRQPLILGRPVFSPGPGDVKLIGKGD